MDAVVSSAVEEICSLGQNGLALCNLWSKLEPSLSASGLDLSNGVKAAVWTQLLRVPSLQFEAGKGLYDAKDPSIQSFEAAERLNLKVVAKVHLRDSFVGLYNVRSASSNMSAHQRRVLERLAGARKNGVTQNQLAKEFGVEGRNFFYVVKSLESQGLIARQSAVVRTKEALSSGELRNSPIVSTNLMYLHRYAKHLGCQQKLEITVEENKIEQLGDPVESAAAEDGLPGKCIKEDVLVKDYLPKMKDICDKLEAANGKVLVVSDIKKDLGYTGSSSGHRAWREVCNRLERACIIQVFEAKVNNKLDCCLRLLKKFSPKCFDMSTTLGSDDISGYKHHMKFGRKCQVTDQLTELAIEHQIYDMIDAAGFEGITVMTVCKRLGIDHKRNYGRLVNMFTRFGMHLQAETHNKCNLYRVWTHGNFKPECINQYFHKPTEVNKEIVNVNGSACSPQMAIQDHNLCDFNRLVQTTFPHGCAKSNTIFNIDNASRRKTKDGKMNTEVSHKLHGDGEVDLRGNHLPQESIFQPACSVPDVEPSSVNAVVETISGSTTSPSALLRPSISAPYQKYPCLPLTVGSARREQKILERLQDEKFILKGELHRWIIDQETDKNTTTDRRTIFRSINKLQSEGHCKCIDINVPVVTNCGRTRITQVILHPSIETLSPQLLGEIHDKMRSFEAQSRGYNSKKVKKRGPVPVLEGIQRIEHYMDSDIASIRSEAMRANGFVLAKMIRAKLLHSFLWDYLNCSDGSDNSSSDMFVHDLKNPHTCYKPFSLEDAIRSIPIELFLQVVGSTKNFDDMLEKCKRGLSLADLAPEEYKHLMDANATGRLSLIIDILRRLKLVRFVAASPGNVNDHGHAILKHALELKPYIEEPVSNDATRSLITRGLDLRPRIRHDFILSSRQAVNEYWQTLEYCYATADPRSAMLAFPGSAVRETFLFRSWASTRVMTAEQRAALLDLVAKRDLREKLSYRECEKIAKDLNLTLEQVLRMYYDRCQQRLKSFDEGTGNESRQKIKRNSPQRKKNPRERSGKRARHDVVSKLLDGTRVTTFPETSISSIDKDKQLANSGEQNIPLQEIFEDDNHLETVEEFGSDEEGEASCSVASSMMKPTRQRRFIWTDETDRQLIIHYARYRAARGTKFSRTNWCSISNLPAPPGNCRKRIAWLNGSIRFRKLVMRLCNILGKRYVKYLEKSKNSTVHQDDPKLILTSSKGKGLNIGGSKHNSEDPQEQWDDFDDKDVKMALDEVLHFKKMTMLEDSKRVGSAYGDFVDANSVHQEGAQHKFPRGRSKARCFHRRLMKILNGRHASKEVFESLAVSNAVELFKLVFLSTSTTREVPNLLAENLRRYSEHDLFSAFSHLREKKIMIGGTNGDPFVLSQTFLHMISKSPFPANTGERASRFSKFLHEREKDLVENGINLPADLQCGDIFHLFALVSSGELSISSCLPDNGVGEPEDVRNLKRKVDSEHWVDVSAKKLKLAPGDGEIISRREKGFPGIMVSVCRTTILRTDAMELSNSWNCIDKYIGGSDRFCVPTTDNSISFDHMEARFDTDGVVSLLGNRCESTWQAMAAFADHLMAVGCDQQVSIISPEVFRLVYSAIQLAGDQGLSIEEVSQVANLQGEKLPQLIVDVLQTYQQVLKVNSFDSVRYVDALYRSKYFLTSIAGSNQNHVTPSVDMLGRNDSQKVSRPESYNVRGKNPENHISDGANSQNMIVGEVHKVTILNLPPEVDENTRKSKTSSIHQSSPKDKTMLTTVGNEDGGLNMPILPWINGDGTTNKIVYKGLRRRMFGIVMQNPGILEIS
ncbi:B-block_TFIIIC domain-containing protein [Cucumis melo var. makuwa]|uniref:B-block_TFIIIC domain-containing protein n=1 Tax=Cucumis melo var. makuwa TaxID=1194695 RepID=A0A5A7VKG0_CUCMM|nr:B-block_TFIIIC domain-containing protein [Cucumis melo var. makuwa]